MHFSTCDLCDGNEEKLTSGELIVLPPVFRSYGKRGRFAGRAATLKVFEDNVMVRGALEHPGEGRVLVIDGGGSLRCALVGGNLGVLAERNGWSGILVDGCIRDVDELAHCDVGVRALASHPQRSRQLGAGERDLTVSIRGVMLQPGDWIYADADGVLVSRNKLS